MTTNRPAPDAPGRPRDLELDERILAATRELLATAGYARTSVAAVAKAAGTTRPSVYLRWPTKEDLVTAAIATMPLPLPLPVTTDVRSDLLAELHHFRAAVGRPNGMALVGNALAEEATTPALLARFRERLLGPRRRRVDAILRRGIDDGILDADLDLAAATNVLIGAFYARYLADSDLPEDWPERVVDTLWRGWMAQS